MKREKLVAEKRELHGKKVRHLRKEGILPGNVYGKKIDSLSLQIPLKEFTTVYDKVHETGLIDLEIDGKTHAVLIHNVQISPINFQPLHADFFEVNLKEKITASIPVEAVGEAKAVTEKVGMLLQLLNDIEVEALPADLPEKFEIDIEGLENVDDQITVETLKTPSEVAIVTDPSQVIFRIGELVSEEAEELAEEEAAAAETASEEAQAEGETSAKSNEGEESTERTEESSSEEKSE